MFSYFKVTWKDGRQTLFPLAFWKSAQMEANINPDDVVAGELVTLDEAVES